VQHPQKHTPTFGRTFIRAAIADLIGGPNPDEREQFCLRRWGAHRDTPILRTLNKSIGAVTTDDFDTVYDPGASEIFEIIKGGSIIGKLPGARETEFDLRILNVSTASGAAWVQEGSNVPLSKSTFTGTALKPKKIAGVVVCTTEVLRRNSNLAEALIQADLTRACQELIDFSFIDPTNAGGDSAPAAVTYGAPSTPSSGDPVSDLDVLLDGFGGDLSNSALITDPRTATQLAMVRSGGGAFLFPNVGPRGGSVLEIPVLVSRSSPRDSSGGQIVLLDGSSVALAMQGLRVERAMHASVLMSDDPDSETPATWVSLFQTNSAGIKATIPANWELIRSDAVSMISGVDYSAS
jgi:HK97 family phage major capsid protein